MDPTFGNLTIMKIHTFCLKQLFTNKKYTENFKEFEQEVDLCIGNVFQQHHHVLEGIEELLKTKLQQWYLYLNNTQSHTYFINILFRSSPFVVMLIISYVDHQNHNIFMSV